MHDSGEPLPSWMPIGEIPARLGALRAARMHRLLPIVAIVGGLAVGGVAGLEGVLVWPGAGSWSLGARSELFVAIAVPVGLAAGVADRWLIPWIARASNLSVRRVALDPVHLRLELDSGKFVNWPLRSVQVSAAETVPGWWRIWLPGSQVTAGFDAPSAVAFTIREAQTRGRPTPVA